MVFPGEHCRITTPTRVRNMRGRTEQGAVLHSPAIRLGRHHVRIYTTKTRCAICGELQRKCSHASAKQETTHDMNMIGNPAIKTGVLSAIVEAIIVPMRSMEVVQNMRIIFMRSPLWRSCIENLPVSPCVLGVARRRKQIRRLNPSSLRIRLKRTLIF